MYQLFTPNNFTDRSPFQYARMTYLKGRVDENYQKLVAMRKISTGRIESSHLLMKLLISLNVEFTGDLIGYMSRVETFAQSICSSLGITASFSKGRVFTDSGFYPGCPEIVVYARNPKWTAMDLWNDWRSVTPIEIVSHPITDTTIVEIGAKNEMKISNPGLAIIHIDIPLLAAQWKMWQAANPGGLMEEYLTTVPLVGAVKSHLNVVMFNKVKTALGISPSCSVGTNITFGQTITNNHADDVVKEVLDKVGGKEMTGNQILSSIPALYGVNYLTSVGLPSMAPTFQVLWALVAQKMEPAAVVLMFGKLAGYNRLLKELTIIRRSLIQMQEDKTLSNGLTTAVDVLLAERLEELVISRLPA